MMLTTFKQSEKKKGFHLRSNSHSTREGERVRGVLLKEFRMSNRSECVYIRDSSKPAWQSVFHVSLFLSVVGSVDI